jgi:STE24 endopeptidase
MQQELGCVQGSPGMILDETAARSLRMRNPLRTPVWCGLAFFVYLFVLTTFIPTPQSAIDTALAAGFTPDDIATGYQYGFERRLIFWASSAVELALLLLLACSAWGHRFAEGCRRATGDRWMPTLLLLGAFYYVVHELLQFPFAVGRFYHAHSWGMTTRGFGDWLRDHAIAFGINAVFQLILLVGFYTLLRVFPKIWWLLAAVGASALGVAYAFLSPLLVAPLFNTFTPLAETEWKNQEPAVRALIAKAGIPVKEILVMDASRQGQHTNAYFSGFGSTRRIVLYDTLLQKHTPAEIESILGHEIGHWVHDHIVVGLAIGTLAAIVGLYLLHRFLGWVVGRSPWRLASPHDAAGLPLLLLIFFAASWFEMPLQNAIRRHFERQADAMALALAGQREAFIEAERRLARNNLSNVAPPPWNVWLFASHPTAAQRIGMAMGE